MSDTIVIDEEYWAEIRGRLAKVKVIAKHESESLTAYEVSGQFSDGKEYRADLLSFDIFPTTKEAMIRCAVRHDYWLNMQEELVKEVV